MATFPNTSASGGYVKPNPLPSPTPEQDEDLVNVLQSAVVGITGMNPKMVRPRWQVQPPNQPANDVDWCAIGVRDRTQDVYPYTSHNATTLARLVCGVLTTDEQLIENWTTITEGAFAISVDGLDPRTVAPLDFTGCIDLDEVASLITQGLMESFIEAICEWQSPQFMIITDRKGMTITAMTEPQVQTDIGAQLKGTVDTCAGIIDGLAGEDVVLRNQDLFVLTSFYGPNADKNCGLLTDGLAIAQNREELAANALKLIEVGNARAVPVLINNKWYYRLDTEIHFRRMVERTYPIFNLESAGGTIESADVTTTFEV